MIFAEWARKHDPRPDVPKIPKPKRKYIRKKPVVVVAADGTGQYTTTNEPGWLTTSTTWNAYAFNTYWTT